MDINSKRVPTVQLAQFVKKKENLKTIFYHLSEHQPDEH